MKTPTRQQASAAVIAAARHVLETGKGQEASTKMVSALEALAKALDDFDAIEEQARQSKQAQTNLSRGYGGNGR